MLDTVISNTFMSGLVIWSSSQKITNIVIRGKKSHMTIKKEKKTGDKIKNLAGRHYLYYVT